MRILENLGEVIGNTPLVRLHRLAQDVAADVVAKVERLNPSGSIKDRLALAVLEEAEREGKVNADTLIVEASSGNTGIGLAFVCAAKGLRLVVTMPESASLERRRIMGALGAEIVLTPADRASAGAIEAAEEICAENPNSVMPDQYRNPFNVEVHRRTTAEEIWRDTDGRVDIVVAATGTGGTVTGIAQLLKERNPGVAIITVEPAASCVISGGEPGPHIIEGIGVGFVPEILDLALIDEVIRVSDDDAADVARRLAREEGIFAGVSSGAALWAGLQVGARPENAGKLIVVVLPDAGDRYLSTPLFSEAGKQPRACGRGPCRDKPCDTSKTFPHGG